MKKYNVAIVGATGLVGSTFLQVLAERDFPIENLYLMASARSAGKEVEYRGEKVIVEELTENSFDKPIDFALFSAGGSTSLKFAPIAASKGCVVIDNSSAWRMDPTVPLVVPEVNPEAAFKHNGIIANPNCSTIQMVLVLAPLHKKYNIKRVIVSTYQSITGTGVKAVQQLENEYAGVQGEMAYKYPIHRNAIPQCDSFEENGYTKEEMKLVRETKKILSDNTIAVTATAVRVPIVGGHSEAVNIEFSNDFDVNEVRSILHHTDGIVVQDNNDTFTYPMPMYAQGKDAVFVGRIRRDESQENTLNMWIVADNLRKGAATNTIQIAEYLIAAKLV